jgi:anti-sigma factor RsiW
MTCAETRDRVFDWLDGSIADRAGFAAHLRACPDCAELLRGIEDDERVLSAARGPVAPPELWPRIAAALSRSRAPARPRLLPWAAAAAIALAVLALFAGTSTPVPTLDLVVVEAGPEARRTFGALVPRYEDLDTATAMADTLFRADY